jgi:hypothetical protein
MNDLPTVEAALKSPLEFILTRYPFLGWSLSRGDDNLVSALISAADAVRIDEAMTAAVAAEKATAYEAP